MLFFISTTFSLCPPLVVCIHTFINVLRWDYFPCLSRSMSPSISCSNPKTCCNCNLQDELCNHWVFLFCWLTRVASGERCLKQLWPPRTQTQHLFSCTLCCSGPPHHIYYAQCSTHLLVCITVSYPAIVYSAHSQSCCVAYYQVVQGNHTCSANNKILLFQSPCTGTRQCGQVISTSSVQIFISSKKWRQLWKTSSLLVFQTLLCLLLTRQGMGASQSSVCQVRKKPLTQSHTIVVHCHAIFIWWFFVVKVETEACGPLARVGAGLGSSLTSTLDLVQVFWSYLYFLYLYFLYLSFLYLYLYFFFGSVQRSQCALTMIPQWVLINVDSKGEVLRQTRSYKEIAGLSYEEFLDYVQDLNEISRYSWEVFRDLIFFCFQPLLGRQREAAGFRGEERNGLHSFVERHN